MTPSFTSGALAAQLGAELVGNPDLTISRLEVIERAGPDTLTFIRDRLNAKHWLASKAPCALITRRVELPEFDRTQRALLRVDDADLTLNTVIDLFAPPASRPAPGRHPTADVDPTATIGAGVYIGPACVVGPGAKIGDGTVLKAQVYIGENASLGRMCVMHPGVRVLDRCVAGDGCIFHAGVVIGADGFGYRPSPDGRGVVKIPHIGNVDIGPGVEIGANTCIDRAKFGSTLIGAGTKIDNLCQVGHGCRIGRACLIAAGLGMAGSCVIGDGVMMGGQVGIADGVTIGPGATIGAQSGVIGNVPPGEAWLGTPAMLANYTLRDWANARRVGAGKPSINAGREARQAKRERPA
ncbi:MAG: UDP-3-O-(3-hydroxymyristoyl)glucosamine N-acyltransferase [Phycisphaerales bacterium]|nr:UDP-3-O-(3-hydroxymyristoyl)glucosamine N-acyltransferase [Phycisphaerales bacterium]